MIDNVTRIKEELQNLMFRYAEKNFSREVHEEIYKWRNLPKETYNLPGGVLGALVIQQFNFEFLGFVMDMLRVAEDSKVVVENDDLMKNNPKYYMYHFDFYEDLKFYGLTTLTLNLYTEMMCIGLDEIRVPIPGYNPKGDLMVKVGQLVEYMESKGDPFMDERKKVTIENLKYYFQSRKEEVSKYKVFPIGEHLKVYHYMLTEHFKAQIGNAKKEIQQLAALPGIDIRKGCLSVSFATNGIQDGNEL